MEHSKSQRIYFKIAKNLVHVSIQLNHHELSLSRPRIMQFSTNLVENHIFLAENCVILDYFNVILE